MPTLRFCPVCKTNRKTTDVPLTPIEVKEELQNYKDVVGNCNSKKFNQKLGKVYCHICDHEWMTVEISFTELVLHFDYVNRLERSVKLLEEVSH